MTRDQPAGPWGAFAVAVTCAALTTAVLAGFAEEARIWGTETTSAFSFVFLLALFLAFPVIALAAAFLGLPLTWLLAHNRWEAPWIYPAAGLVAGAALMIAFDPYGPDYIWLPVDKDAQLGAIGGVPGFVCGLSWWRFHRRHFQAEPAR